jgi:hypothetical protein
MAHAGIDFACRAPASRGRVSRTRYLLRPPRLSRVSPLTCGGTSLSSEDSEGGKTCGRTEASLGWLWSAWG